MIFIVSLIHWTLKVGRRRCVGEDFAKTMIGYFTAGLVHHFRLEFVDSGYNVEDLHHHGFTLAPNPFQIKITRAMDDDSRWDKVLLLLTRLVPRPYSMSGFSFVHFLDYAQLKNSRKSEFLAKNLSFQPKNRWVFLEILSFSKVYWSKPLGIKAEILSFHWYWPEFLQNLSFRRLLWVFRKVGQKRPVLRLFK